MIHLKRGRELDDPGNSGSLNDLSFLLIIFFIVTAGFNIDKGFLLNLPDNAKPRVVQREELVKCSLDPIGNIALDGKAVTLAEAESILKEKRSSHPNMTFLLVIDPETPYQKVVDIIYEIRKLDIENFSFRMSGGNT